MGRDYTTTTYATHKSPYTDAILAELSALGYEGIAPRHVEAYMRCEHSTLDGLDKFAFSLSVGVSAQCVILDGIADAEALAESFGL